MAARVHIVVRGRVQGVGYRYETQRQARAIGITGWVRNRVDGNVEAEFEGARTQLDAMVLWCRNGPPLAAVTSVESVWEDGPGRYSSFDIVG